ncbi:MAG: cysteine desulfurase-like protein [Pirellulales bacterium]
MKIASDSPAAHATQSVDTAQLLERIRQRFPALARQGHRRALCYLDGPAGTQVPTSVTSAITDYLLHHNANSHGLFPASIETDQIVDRTRAALCDFMGTSDPDEFVFGPNMTTLTMSFSRAIAQTWQPGDEIIVTQLDHDANVAPWLLAARDRGVTVHQVRLLKEHCELDLDHFHQLLSHRTKLVAVGAASNAVGTINPIRHLATSAHAAGALVYVDAVHWAPHGRIDVSHWDADFVVCSAYKFFGPHLGILWGRRELLESIEPYKVRPAPRAIPDCWMTGTLAFENVAGTLAAIDYLEWLGEQLIGSVGDRRSRLDAAFDWIGTYERQLLDQLVHGLRDLPGLTIWGLSAHQPARDRAPTISLTVSGMAPSELATQLAARDICSWNGNYYAYNWAEALNLNPAGAVRLGIVHYNTSEEIAYTLECFRSELCHARPT